MVMWLWTVAGTLAAAATALLWRRTDVPLLVSRLGKGCPVHRGLDEFVRSRPFRPSWLLSPSIVQVLLFGKWQSLPSHLKVRRETFGTPDGGTVALDWVEAGRAMDPAGAEDVGQAFATERILVILPTLTSSGPEVYPLAAEAVAAGYRPVIFLKRGHGVPLTTPRLQGFGEIDDLSLCLNEVRRRHPDALLLGIGLSAGSGLLASYFGCTGSESVLEAGVMVSPGYDARKLFLDGDLKWPFDQALAASLKQLYQANQTELEPVVCPRRMSQCSTVREVDLVLYAEPHGHKDLDAYWNVNNPMREFHRVAKPVLSINALDDPVCVSSQIPWDQFRQHPMGMLCATQLGSHVGWFESLDLRTSWYHAVAFKYLDLVLQHKQPTQPVATRTQDAEQENA
eukprot:m.282091 g.282091  ORF g.282091 m.282091 type:complete len:397 (-) comp19405_c0_seq15:68-1258(-)